MQDTANFDDDDGSLADWMDSRGKAKSETADERRRAKRDAAIARAEHRAEWWKQCAADEPLQRFGTEMMRRARVEEVLIEVLTRGEFVPTAIREYQKHAVHRPVYDVPDTSYVDELWLKLNRSKETETRLLNERRDTPKLNVQAHVRIDRLLALELRSQESLRQRIHEVKG